MYHHEWMHSYFLKEVRNKDTKINDEKDIQIDIEDIKIETEQDIKIETEQDTKIETEEIKMEIVEHIEIQDEGSGNTNSDVLIISLSSQQNEALSKLHQSGTVHVPPPSPPSPKLIQEDDTPTTTSVVVISLTPQQNAALLQFQQGGTAKFPDFPVNPSTVYPRKPGEEIIHRCTICKKIFTRGWVLTRHLSTHSGVRPFSCEICGLLFSQKTHLARHQKIHTADKPLKCNYCDKTFLNQRVDNLTRHERQHRERPFMCEICGKGFYRKDHLLRHRQLHKKPFICGTCYKEFYLKNNLVIHIQEKHMKKRKR